MTMSNTQCQQQQQHICRMTTTTTAKLLCGAITLTVILVLSNTAGAKEDSRAIIEDIKKYDNCALQSTFSFNYPVSYPPKTKDELSSLCRSQAEGLKCIREKTKGSPALLRRGLLTFASTRQRQHKRICANLESQKAKQFLQASKCLMDKKFKLYQEFDGTFIRGLEEIARRNYNDSTIELRYICCTFYTFKKNFIDNIAPECDAHKVELEELASSIATDDLTLVCDDDERLSKMCPKLEPLKLAPVTSQTGATTRKSAAGLGLYLMATLGEPNDDASVSF